MEAFEGAAALALVGKMPLWVVEKLVSMVERMTASRGDLVVQQQHRRQVVGVGLGN